MSTDPEFTVVTAMIQAHMEGHVIDALHGLPEFTGFSLTEVRGQGRGQGVGGSYTATEFGFSYQRHLQIQIVCRTEQARLICRTIAEAARTGHKGDGIIFTTPAADFVRIREFGRPGPETTR
ncbi:Nitrogen regulatory protein P-II [Rhodoplanes serenus]|uniref:Nitrogen regulatory protein P-II n=1 Tax=Rhodoplanes serenus TaxID=200615 RepID=A0A3S5CYA6_9BRAD|nr:P-II family nitrogen regulator [Rhodoplanes serenus]MBI5113247.1 P-II family nitrogen regulator [Rhodovulum sp.]VCU08490.1 Nitrogen regulatory protein P-II [Rhodoplanes serenus]